MIPLLTFRNTSIYFIFSLLILAQGFGQHPTPDPELAARILKEGEAPMLVTFPMDKSIFADAGKLGTKADKGRFVYEALRRQADESQRDVTAFLTEKGLEYRTLWIANAIAVRGNAELLEALTAFASIQSIVPDPEVYMQPLTPAREASPQALRSDDNPTWGIRNIQADSVWSLGFEGEGIVIGGQDTGYDWEHPALSSNYRGNDGGEIDHNYNWHDAIHEISPLNADSINPCGLNVKMPCDDGSHGTHTMGTMAGTQLNGVNIGVAPKASWIGCRCMERGWGSPSTYLECFQWFLAPTDLEGENPDPEMAPHVINNSWSCPEIEGCNPANFALLNDAVAALRAAGIVVVVSAGNSGSQCSSITTPAAIFDASFTVGAIAANDTIAGFSSRGPVMVDSSGRMKPDVVAPGVQVYSARPDSAGGFANGTSMSGPHVAGLVALLLSAEPSLAGDVDMIESIIQSTARPMTTIQDCGESSGMESPNNTYGFGIVNALEAVKAIMAVSTDEPDHDPVEFRVSPNPTSGKCTVIIETFHSGSIEVFDQMGLLVYTRSIAPETSIVNLNLNLPAGLYYLGVSSEAGQQFQKLVVY